MHLYNNKIIDSKFLKMQKLSSVIFHVYVNHL